MPFQNCYQNSGSIPMFPAILFSRTVYTESRHLRCLAVLAFRARSAAHLLQYLCFHCFGSPHWQGFSLIRGSALASIYLSIALTLRNSTGPSVVAAMLDMEPSWPLGPASWLWPQSASKSESGPLRNVPDL